MASIPSDRIRNIGIVAHIDAGKTTTTERFLFYSGKSHKIGEVHDGQAIMDYRQDERDRGITISAAATTLEWGGYRINLIDTPGHVDFTAEVERALRVLDGAVVIFDGVEGVEPQSETVWHQADRYRVPRIAFINKIDRVGADFDAAVASIREKLDGRPFAIQFPDGSAQDFLGVVDLVEFVYRTFDEESFGRTMRVDPVPERLRGETERRRALLVESLAELHEPLADRWLSEQPIESSHLHDALRAATLEKRGVPVLCGAALRNVGVQPVLDAICRYLPSPREVPPVEGVDPRDGSRVTREPDPEGPFSALVFKQVADSAADQYYLRAYSGRLEAGGRAFNPRTGGRERLRRPLRMHADRGKAVEVIEAGDIVVVSGLQKTATGDTLCDEGFPVLLETIHFPETVVSIAVEPRASAERDRLAEVLDRMQREDPTLRVKVDAETGQTLLSGMGELHLEVVLDRMKRDFKVAVAHGKPRVSFRETVARTGEGAAEYRRQVAGDNLFARVGVQVSPSGNAGAGPEVESALPEGSVPAAMMPAILEALRNAAQGGGSFGYPVTGIRTILREAVYDDVGQPEIALNSAASLAFRHALDAAGSVVLEPYGRLEIRVPEEFLGAVVKTLNQRRAIVEDTRVHGSGAVIRGVVPIGEMFGYLTVLRSQTQGRGSFSLEPLDFRPVPDNLVATQHERLWS